MEENTSTVSEKNEKRAKRNGVILKITFLLLIIALASFLYWFFFIRNRAWTDDAYVSGNSVMLMSPQAGIVVAIYADDTEYVKEGQILVQLDPTMIELEFERAKVALALAARQVKQLQEDVEQRKADLILQQANLTKAREDYESRVNIQNLQAISREDLNHARANLEVAEAAFSVAQHQLEATLVALGNTRLENHPTIESAKVPVQEAYINLMRTRILSPIDGFIAKRNVQLGEWVTPTRSLMSIIPLNQIWVDANFKETQLTYVRVGQPVTITTDLYGSGVIYHGQVDGIEPGTGSVFSLLPPQNASGNWIKIVQRLPVRTYLDPNELKEHPLRLGLSTYVTVDITDVEEKKILEPHPNKAKFTTSVFNISIQPIEELMQEIIRTNLNSNRMR